ncbi:ionotropic receptor 75a-like [Periplaneta americana]|uniref:ionotropic receptor 75a-like n=1 Tax=Periplaneta americana TaxID=6978 RepID=UPI0037E85454
MENRRKDSMATYNYYIFHHLEEVHNFSVDIKTCKTFGYEVDDGKLEGLTQMMKNRDIDLSISTGLMNHARYRYMDFVPVPTWEFRPIAMFRHPESYGAVLLKPFEVKVWASCAGMWLVVILAIRFASRVETSTSNLVATTHEEETVRSWSDSIMVIIGAVSEQGTDTEPKWLAGRTVILAAFTLSMMTNVYYSAVLVSLFLSMPAKTILTPEDLLESSLQFAAEDTEYNMLHFKTNEDPLVQELYRGKMAPPNNAFYSYDVGFNKMRRERFVFHTEALKMYSSIQSTFSEKDECDLTEVIIFLPQKYYLAIPWESPYKEMFSVTMSRMYESGLINYQDRLWKSYKPACLSNEEYKGVDMDKIAPAFLIIGSGIIAALIVLAGEIFTKRRLLYKMQQIQDTTGILHS